MPKKGMSYTWRSILQGIELLKKGLIWRIGRGDNVNIWSDPWMPTRVTRKISTPRAGCILTRVAELMDPITGSWDHVLVRDNFWEQDAEEILRIPVNPDLDDRPAWHFDKRGMFTVKSAYNVFCEEQKNRRGGRAEGSNPAGPDREDVWQKLWKLKCPGKVKHFLWRLGHNTHALCVNLKMRSMDVDTRCFVCRRLDEDGGHLFFKCKYVKELWLNMGLQDECNQMTALNSGKEVLKYLVNLKDEKMIVITTLMWVWWGERNRIREGEVRRGTDILVHIITKTAHDYAQAYLKPVEMTKNRGR